MTTPNKRLGSRRRILTERLAYRNGWRSVCAQVRESVVLASWRSGSQVTIEAA